MGWGTLGLVWDRSRDPQEGLGYVGGLSVRSGTGKGTLEEVRDWLQKSGTGRGTLGEVWDGLGDPWGGPGRVK